MTASIPYPVVLTTCIIPCVKLLLRVPLCQAPSSKGLIANLISYLPHAASPGGPSCAGVAGSSVFRAQPEGLCTRLISSPRRFFGWAYLCWWSQQQRIRGTAYMHVHPWRAAIVVTRALSFLRQASYIQIMWTAACRPTLPTAYLPPLPAPHCWW